METSSARRPRVCLVCLALVCLQVWLLRGEDTRVPTEDVLLPYSEGHGPSHSHQHVMACQSVTHGETTYETWPSDSRDALPVAESTVFISDADRSRWVFGHLTVVHDPLRTLSVLEPGAPGGCEMSRRVTVEETSRSAGCLYAQNAGFFNTSTDGCLGNVVSDGRMVRDSSGVQNAQFGIRRDGSLVFGYLSQDDVLDQSNPFVQLVSGVVWLLRNGEVYINQSMKAECNRMVDQEVFSDFVDVLSARTVVGHDASGNVVLFHVDGQTEKRGMNLWEVAQLLKKHGVINAINLDGGGSSSFVINGTLASYPPDVCKPDSRWRCARAVSTVLCVHRRRCQPADCGGRGVCEDGRCRCQDGWRGAACDALRCRPAACGAHGVCTARGCVCAAGWRGKYCNKECVPGFFGDGCRNTCICFNGASCNHVSGRCSCLPGFYGNFCQHVCPPGYYGLHCAERCECDDQCPCDPMTGSCVTVREGSLSRAGQCLAKQMLTLWRQQEESNRDEPYLSEQTWLIISASLAFLLFLRLLVNVTRTGRRWLLFSFSHTYFSQRVIKKESLPASCTEAAETP